MFNQILTEIKAKNIRGVLLDLDNTLYRYEPCHRYALRQCYWRFKKLKTISFDEFKQLYKQAQVKVKKHTAKQAASHSRFLYFQELLEQQFGRTEVKLTLRFEKLYWQGFFKKMKLKPAAARFLKSLKKEGVKVCLVTDLTAKIQFEKIVALGLETGIDFIVSSEEAGIEKPHRRIFLLALQKLGLQPNKALVVGDDKDRDVAGAQTLGLRIAHIRL